PCCGSSTPPRLFSPTSPATTELYPLSLHDALPIYAFIRISGFSAEELHRKAHNIVRHPDMPESVYRNFWDTLKSGKPWLGVVKRSEEHTSELQSRENLVCRLLLEKKKRRTKVIRTH